MQLCPYNWASLFYCDIELAPQLNGTAPSYGLQNENWLQTPSKWQVVKLDKQSSTLDEIAHMKDEYYLNWWIINYSTNGILS